MMGEMGGMLMKRNLGRWAAMGMAVGMVLLGVRAARTLPAGEPAADPTGYVRGVPGPVTAVLARTRGSEAFAGTGSGVYRSGDGGRTWVRIFRVGIGRGPVRALAYDRSGETLYVVARGGLYRSSAPEFRWSRVLGGRPEVFCAAVSSQDPSRVLAGTARGLAVSTDGGSRWEAPAQGGPQGPVLQVLFDPARRGTCYLLSEHHLFRSEDGGKSWDRVRLHATAAPETGGTEGAEAEADNTGAAEDPTPADPRPQRLTADGQGNLYLGMDSGILMSPDAGRTWSALPTGGMGAAPVSHLLSDPAPTRMLYAVIPAGLFVYSEDWRAWRPVREGLEAQGVDSLGLDVEAGQLWVGTRRGLFRVPAPGSGHPLNKTKNGLKNPTKNGLKNPIQIPPGEASQSVSAGPPVGAVQAAAVRYAEVHPGKVSRWRALARWRSLFPTFTIGLDQDRDATIASSTSQGVTRFNVGPERRSLSVDLGFTWDLADLIWNPAQTSIDVRSRLMVQLRQELLEEVTRLYFERKRLVSEFAGHPSEDPLLNAERSLRVEELTAQMDALTGGWFSENSEND